MLAAQARDQAGDQQRHPVAAGVDDAVLAQHRQQIRAALHRCLGRLERLLEHFGEHAILLLSAGVMAQPRRLHPRQLGRHTMGHLSHHRDHRSLCRIANRRVGGVGRARERRRDQHRIDQLAGTAGQLLGRAANDLGEDHAAVARAPSSAARATASTTSLRPTTSTGWPLRRSSSTHHGAQRLGHVVSRVPSATGKTLRSLTSCRRASS